IGALLTGDPRVDMVSFTGSTATGRLVMKSAADTIKKVFLELGGKSVYLMLDDVDDVAAAMAMAAFGVCTHAGQGCAITTRLLLPRSRYDEGVEAVAALLASVEPGDPSDPATMTGPLINASQRDRVQDYVDHGVAAGARVVVGGGRPEHHPVGFFFEPTLLADVTNDMAVAQEEIFGPVLVAIPYDDTDDAVAIANDSPYGLSASVVSDDEQRAIEVGRRIRTGTMSINGGIWYGPDVPFGGYKQSGIGREMGQAGFEEYLETKSFARPAN
ncbi:MAG: aldehyde dehydrogenase family protein, partial [Acidimicrobiales bacterium]